jgi:hypothetical protein
MLMLLLCPTAIMPQLLHQRLSCGCWPAAVAAADVWVAAAWIGYAAAAVYLLLLSLAFCSFSTWWQQQQRPQQSTYLSKQYAK